MRTLLLTAALAVLTSGLSAQQPSSPTPLGNPTPTVTLQPQTIYPSTTMQPGTIIYPSGQMMQNGTIIYPSRQMMMRNGTVVYPSGQMMMRNGTIVYPSTTMRPGTVVYQSGRMVQPGINYMPYASSSTVMQPSTYQPIIPGTYYGSEMSSIPTVGSTVMQGSTPLVTYNSRVVNSGMPVYSTSPNYYRGTRILSTNFSSGYRPMVYQQPRTTYSPRYSYNTNTRTRTGRFLLGRRRYR